jgi:hypothetical protein
MRLHLRRIVLNPVDDLSRDPRRLRDDARAGVLREHVADGVELRSIEARLPAPITARLGGLGVRYASLLGLSSGRHERDHSPDGLSI